MEIIQKWIAERTFDSPDCRSNKIEIGGLDLSMLLQRDGTGISDPLQITLQSDQYPAVQALFNIPAEDGSQIIPAAIKKIAGTPFYHSYLAAPSFIADIIDFYDWRKDLKLYRIFILQNYGSSPALHISFPDSQAVVKLGKNVFQVGNFYWSTQSDLQLDGGQNGLLLKTRSDSGQTAILTVSISLNTDAAGLDIETPSYKVLKSLAAAADQHHIKNYYSSNDSTIQHEIDEWWTRQKTITPDWQIARTILNDPVRYQLRLTWAMEIALYFNNWELLRVIQQTLQRNSNTVKESSRLLFIYSRLKNFSSTVAAEHPLPAAEFDRADPFRDCLVNSNPAGTETGKLTETQILYRSYFSGNADSDITADTVQRCWNRLSLPLFANKLDRELKENPEKIIILYLLSLYHGFPFASVLAGIIAEKVSDPVLRLFVLLQQQIQKRSAADSLFNFKDGCQQNYTGKTLNLFDQSSLRLSRFSKRFYVQYISADKFHFRIDKKIHCFVDNGQRRISVYPDVPFYPQQASADQRTEVQSSGYKVSWPWLWPKAEVQCSGIRFRWIFKKRRYQITIQKKKGTADLTIDGRVIADPAQQKTIHYYEVKNSAPEILIKAWDKLGREAQLWRKDSARQIQLAGWAKNRHNQFVDQINFNYGPRQHCLRDTARNGLHSLISIPATVQTVTFSTKKMKYNLELNYSENPFWEKFFYFPAINGHGCLAVAIDDILKRQFSHIQDFFNEYLAFQPKYFFVEQNKLHINSNLLIHICATAEGVTVRRDTKVMKFPYLFVGVQQGIEQLKRFSDAVEQNLIKVNTGSCKRSGKA